jgi:hypothetical protein
MAEGLSVVPAFTPQVAEFHLEHPNAPQDPALSSTADDGLKADVGDFLVVSPYTSRPHLLDLRPLDISQRLLARALTVLQPMREDYATAPYAKAFNWDDVVGELRALAFQSAFSWRRQHFYIVVFRSQVPPSTNRIQLGELDEKSHAEATKSGGLLKYWFGMPDENGMNLATCEGSFFPYSVSKWLNSLGVWRKQEDARPASTGPGHKAAMRATISMYSEWRIERLKFEISDGARTWSIEAWEV